MTGSKRSVLAIAAACIAVPSIVVGGGLALSQTMATKPPTCGSMTEAVDDSRPTSQLIVEVVANTDKAATEAAEFVRQHVDLGSPESTEQIQVTILIGKTTEEASDDGCLGRILAIATGRTDRKAYRKASPKKQEDLADILLAQKRNRLELVAKSVRDAILEADDPGKDHGAFYLWNLIAEAPAGADVAALASPTVSSHNCIQTDEPSLPAEDGRPTIEGLVEDCVHAGQVNVVQASSVTVVQPSSLGLDELQKSAGADVLDALCTYATATSATCSPGT